VRAAGPIGLDDDSEPEPDVAVVPGDPDDYSRAHPSRPVLTLEVAESSLASDRRRKGSLYARARLDVFDVSARVGPLAVPGASVRVADLFP
jgi:Uma2 family endonuclease